MSLIYLEGFNPLSSGAMTAGSTDGSCEDDSIPLFQSPFKRGNDCGCPFL